MQKFGRPRDWALLTTFWANFCGEWITRLELEKVDFVDGDTFRNVLCCRFTPSLEHLSISEVDDFGLDEEEKRELEDYDMSPNNEFQAVSESDMNPRLKTFKIKCNVALAISWTELLQFYPRLQHLRLEQFAYDCDIEAKRMLQAITKIRGTDKTKLMLKCLDLVDLGEYSNEEDLEDGDLSDLEFEIGHKFPPLLNSCLQKSHLFLDTLEFDLGMDTPDEIILAVLTHQSQTLRKLGLGRDAPLRNYSFFPTMSSLTTLGLMDRPFDNLHFLTACPKLESLVFTCRYSRFRLPSIIEKTREEVMDGLVIPSLTEFSYSHKATFSAEDLGRLAKWMPNLKDIRTGDGPLSNETLRMICKLWPSTLEKLSFCQGGGIDDEGITGIPRGCERLGIRLYPNVTDLKECRMLHAWHGERNATEKSVLLGFLQMPKLQDFLFFTNSISSETMSMVKEKLQRSRVEYKQLIT